LAFKADLQSGEDPVGASATRIAP